MTDTLELHEKSTYQVDRDRIEATDILRLQVQKKIDEDTLEDYFENHLHGSGWDGNWRIDEGPYAKNICATIEYHHMDENGYYDGWSRVNVYLTRTLDILRITFSTDRRLREKYIAGQDDYFSDCIYEAVADIRTELLQEVFDERKAWRIQRVN